RERKVLFSEAGQGVLMGLCVAGGRVTSRALFLSRSFSSSAPAEPSSRPGRWIRAPSRAATVKTGPRFRAAEGLVLYGREHDGTLRRDGHGRFTAVRLCLWTCW